MINGVWKLQTQILTSSEAEREQSQVTSSGLFLPSISSTSSIQVTKLFYIIKLEPNFHTYKIKPKGYIDTLVCDK